MTGPFRGVRCALIWMLLAFFSGAASADVGQRQLALVVPDQTPDILFHLRALCKLIHSDRVLQRRYPLVFVADQSLAPQVAKLRTQSERGARSDDEPTDAGQTRAAALEDLRQKAAAHGYCYGDRSDTQLARLPLRVLTFQLLSLGDTRRLEIREITAQRSETLATLRYQGDDLAQTVSALLFEEDDASLLLPAEVEVQVAPGYECQAPPTPPVEPPLIGPPAPTRETPPPTAKACVYLGGTVEVAVKVGEPRLPRAWQVALEAPPRWGGKSSGYSIHIKSRGSADAVCSDAAPAPPAIKALVPRPGEAARAKVTPLDLGAHLLRIPITATLPGRAAPLRRVLTVHLAVPMPAVLMRDSALYNIFRDREPAEFLAHLEVVREQHQILPGLSTRPQTRLDPILSSPSYRVLDAWFVAYLACWRKRGNPTWHHRDFLLREGYEPSETRARGASYAFFGVDFAERRYADRGQVLAGVNLAGLSTAPDALEVWHIDSLERQRSRFHNLGQLRAGGRVRPLWRMTHQMRLFDRSGVPTLPVGVQRIDRPAHRLRIELTGTFTAARLVGLRLGTPLLFDAVDVGALFSFTPPSPTNLAAVVMDLSARIHPWCHRGPRWRFDFLNLCTSINPSVYLGTAVNLWRGQSPKADPFPSDLQIGLSVRTFGGEPLRGLPLYLISDYYWVLPRDPRGERQFGIRAALGVHLL